MTTSVENRRFTHMEPATNGVVRTFKSVQNNHRSDTPDRNRPFPSIPDITRPNKAIITELDSSSEDEDENDFWELVQKGDSELEPPIWDQRDEATSDNWVQRNPTMVRLTPSTPSRHLLGSCTPAPLHYVRNHGPVLKGN